MSIAVFALLIACYALVAVGMFQVLREEEHPVVAFGSAVFWPYPAGMFLGMKIMQAQDGVLEAEEVEAYLSGLNLGEDSERPAKEERAPR